MSGPKVVNIEAVRRRQKREGLAQLSKLKLALAECERWNVSATSSALLARLEAMREAEQWDLLLNEAGAQNLFYEEEAVRLQEQHAAEQAAALRRAHRFEQSLAQATALLKSLPISAQRDALLHQLSSGDSSSQQSALNAALHFIGNSRQNQSTARLRELAASFVDAAAAAAPAVLPSVQAPTDPQEKRLEKCWNLLGELSALGDSPDIQALIEKARAINLSPAEHQPLLLDSLALELSSHLQNRRAAKELLHDVHILLAELEEVRSPVVAEWRRRLNEVLAQSSLVVAPVRSLVEEARAWIEKTFADETRAEQRAAVLCALAAAGYEVREGMAVAWAEKGRLVLRKPNESSYGIEVSAPPNGNAIQTRVVAFGKLPRDSQRDFEVEETWCGEFERARSMMCELGFETSLIQAQPAGSVQVKAVTHSLLHFNEDPRKQLDLGTQKKFRD